MKPFYLTVCFYLCFQPCLQAQLKDLFYLYGTSLTNEPPSAKPAFLLEEKGSALFSLLQGKEATTFTLYRTKKGYPVEAYFFPGRSRENAVVIGGLHGSELSSIEVARSLLALLPAGEKPYYNVVVIPSVFPDNAAAAKADTGNRIQNNTGRYSHALTADPNRQMPLPGRPFTSELPYDALCREIEGENQVLLQLIQWLKPERLIAIHAIKDRSKAGIFADPRTDCNGTAIGFATDSALAVTMAKSIEALGGACPGNLAANVPTAVYYLDPPPAAPGQKQWRNYETSKLQGRGRGISLGTWCSTAVCAASEEKSRPAIRTFTMEFPGSLVPAEYKTHDEQALAARMISLYAASIQHYFLQLFFDEETGREALPSLAARD